MNDQVEVRDSRNPGWLWADRNVIKRDGQRLGPYGLSTYFCLCAHANTEQEAWPSVATIAAMIGCSERKVREMLKLLEELGWITIEQRYDPDRKQYSSNRYRLLNTPTAQQEGGTAPHAVGGTAQDAVGTAPHAEERKPINESQSSEQEEIPSGADAPQPSADNAGPITFEAWLTNVQSPPDGSNRIAQLKRMHDALFPTHDPVDYGRVGACANRVGGAGRLAQLLWETATKRPNGNVLDYIEATDKARKKQNGRQSAQSVYDL